MLFDIVLPSIVSIVTAAVVLLYGRFEIKIKTLFEEKEFRIRDAVYLVIAMTIMVTIVVLAPQQAIQILFLAAYSFVLFLFTYIAAEKWYLAILPPIAFVGLYFLFWDLIILNIFAIVFAIMVSLYMGGLFSWKTVLVFAGLLTAMDVIQVFGTGFMGSAAVKFVDLRLPVFIAGSTFPRIGFFLLGLGDIFLAGLLAVQTMQKYGRRAGVVSAVATGVAFFFFEVAAFSFEFASFFPATLVVVVGWLLGLGITRLVGQRLAS